MIENTIVYYDYYTFLSKKEIIKNAVVLEKSNKPASHLCSVTKHYIYYTVLEGEIQRNVNTCFIYLFFILQGLLIQ